MIDDSNQLRCGATFLLLGELLLFDGGEQQKKCCRINKAMTPANTVLKARQKA